MSHVLCKRLLEAACRCTSVSRPAPEQPRAGAMLSLVTAGCDACAWVQLERSSEEAHQAELGAVRARLREAEERVEGLRRGAREADTLRARAADLEAAAASAGQWQEAYGQLQRELQAAQVGCL